MIRITDWVADIPEEDKRIAYMGESGTCQRQFLLTGEDAVRYLDWTFRLDVQFDVSTVTSTTTRHTERVEEERAQSMSLVHEDERTTTTKESGTVTDVTVDCENTGDVIYLSREVCEEGLLLTWTVLAQHTRLPGRLWATLRAQYPGNMVKKTAVMLFTVDESVESTPASTPTLSEFEQMERDMDGRLVAFGELTEDMREAAATAGAHVATIKGDKEQTAAYKDQAAAYAKQAVEAAEGVHKSAYDVAVDNGFVGTQKEWLDSLQGATTDEIKALETLVNDAARRADVAAENANGAAAGVLTIEQNNGVPLRFWVGTQAEYEALTEKDATCFYLISDDQTVDDLEKTLAEHTRTLGQHTATLAQHTSTLAKHDDKIIEHNTLFVKQEAKITEHEKDIALLKSVDYVVDENSLTDTNDHYDDLGILQYTDKIVWSWRKWNSGRFELWGTHTVNTTVDIPFGALYESGEIFVGLPFKAYGIVPIVDCNDAHAFGSSCVFPNDDGTYDSFYYVIHRGGAYYMRPWYVNIYVTGRWK